MEGILMFVSIVMIVFGILQIILFFKMWGMTNDVKSIENRLNNQNHSYEFYMLSGEKEKAFQLVKSSLISYLIELRSDTYYGDKRFIELANKKITEYMKQMEATGLDIPNHLLSGEAFIEYQNKIKTL